MRKKQEPRSWACPFLPVFPRQPTVQKFPWGQISKGGESTSKGKTRPGSLNTLGDSSPSATEARPSVILPQRLPETRYGGLKMTLCPVILRQVPLWPQSSASNGPQGRNHYYPHFTNGSNRDHSTEPSGAGAQAARAPSTSGGQAGGGRARAV